MRIIAGHAFADSDIVHVYCNLLLLHSWKTVSIKAHISSVMLPPGLGGIFDSTITECLPKLAGACRGEGCGLETDYDGSYETKRCDVVHDAEVTCHVDL